MCNRVNGITYFSTMSKMCNNCFMYLNKCSGILVIHIETSFRSATGSCWIDIIWFSVFSHINQISLISDVIGMTYQLWPIKALCIAFNMNIGYVIPIVIAIYISIISLYINFFIYARGWWVSYLFIRSYVDWIYVATCHWFILTPNRFLISLFDFQNFFPLLFCYFG